MRTIGIVVTKQIGPFNPVRYNVVDRVISNGHTYYVTDQYTDHDEVLVIVDLLVDRFEQTNEGGKK